MFKTSVLVSPVALAISKTVNPIYKAFAMFYDNSMVSIRYSVLLLSLYYARMFWVCKGVCVLGFCATLESEPLVGFVYGEATIMTDHREHGAKRSLPLIPSMAWYADSK